MRYCKPDKLRSAGASYKREVAIGQSHFSLGNRKGTTSTSQATEIWQYNDNEKAWIPFFAIGGGKFKYTIMNFGSDGKVKEWSTSNRARSRPPENLRLRAA